MPSNSHLNKTATQQRYRPVWGYSNLRQRVVEKAVGNCAGLEKRLAEQGVWDRFTDSILES